MNENQTFPVQTICKILDLTEARVGQLVKQGVFEKKERGRYELVPVVRAYIHYLRNRAVKGDVSTGDDYAAHRARLTKAKADMAEMEREQMANRLIPADDVEQAWCEVIANFRAKMLSIPTQAAADTQSASTLAEAKQVLKTKVNEALDELTQVRVQVVNPIRASEPDEDSDKGDTDSNTTA